MSKLERGFEYPRKGEDESPRVRSSPWEEKNGNSSTIYMWKEIEEGFETQMGLEEKGMDRLFLKSVNCG